MHRRKRAGNADSRRYNDWLARAGEDLACVAQLVACPQCYNCATFHCQQAIEKSLKGFLLMKSGFLPDGHNLSWLVKQAAKLETAFTGWLAPCTMLNRCYIETRYPADFPLGIDLTLLLEYQQTANSIYILVCEQAEKIPKRRMEDS